MSLHAVVLADPQTSFSPVVSVSLPPKTSITSSVCHMALLDQMVLFKMLPEGIMSITLMPTVMAKILFCTFDLRHDWLSIKVQHFKVHNFPHSDKHIPAVTAPPVPRLQPWRSLWGLFLATHMALFHFIILY